MFNDITSVTLETAIAGLSARQQVTTNNIANLETPGFRARSVAFESSLADAVAAGEPGRATVSAQHTDDVAHQNGNNVNLEREMITATKTVLQQKLITGAVTSRFGLISTVLKG